MKKLFTLFIILLGFNCLDSQQLILPENSNDLIPVALFAKVSDEKVVLGSSAIKLHYSNEALAFTKQPELKEYSSFLGNSTDQQGFTESSGATGYFSQLNGSFFPGEARYFNFPQQAEQYQSPYRVNWPIYGGIAGLSGLFYFLSPESEALTQQEIDDLKIEDINQLDRGVTAYFAPSLAKQSDVFLYGSFLLGGIVPLAYPALSKSENKVIVESAKVFGMYAGAFLLCYTGTKIVKSAVLRTRPYVYNADATYDKHEVDARYSFFSGHSSHTAFNTFFAARVFSDYFPESRYKAVVWGAAAIIPAYTAALRVAAGKHFYTDVIAGYGYGALCGVIVPYVFSTKRKYNDKLTIYPTNTLGASGLGIVYRL